MKWFEGDIPRAIQKAKTNHSLFIVFISGDDSKSPEMESYLHHEEVTGLLEDNKCVAIRLLADSNELKFFGQIYPVVVIPSTFFIADTGIPLEVIGQCQSQEDFLARARKAVELQNSSSESAAGASVTAGATAAVTAGATAAVTAGATAAVTAGATAAESSQYSRQSPTPATTQPGSTHPQSRSRDEEDELPEDETNAGFGGAAASAIGLEEKLNKAKQLLEEKRIEKQRKEAEDERRRELERRNTGQNVAKLRQQQKDNEILEAKMELKKDRDEDKLARKKIKEEIERDRLEKAARWSKDKDERTLKAEEAKKKKLAEQQAVLAEEQARRSETARIQFRLPDGSSVTQQFAATDTFGTVQDFITEHMGTPVTLSMTFPRRTFTTEDRASTLQELQLAPNAAVMVLPRGVSTSVVRSSSGIFSLSGLTNLVMAPVLFLWNLIGSLLGLNRPATPGSNRPATPGSNRPASSGSKQVKAATSPTFARGGERTPGSASSRRPAASRQDGSVTRFHNPEDDSDDENRNTWNGNSTQQM